MKKEPTASKAACNAADRHETETGHITMDLWNDDSTKVDGKCCHDCDWMRYNVEPRRKKSGNKNKLEKVQLTLPRLMMYDGDGRYVGLVRNEHEFAEYRLQIVEKRLKGCYFTWKPDGNDTKRVNFSDLGVPEEQPYSEILTVYRKIIHAQGVIRTERFEAEQKQKKEQINKTEQ